MDLKVLESRLPSGRVRRAGRLPMPKDSRPVVLCLGESVAERVYASQLFQKGHLRAVLAPVRVEAPTRSRKAANPLLPAIRAASKEHALPRVVIAQASIPATAGYMADLWSSYSFADTVLAGSSPKLRHDGLLAAVHSALPTRGPNDAVILVVEAPSDSKTPASTRLAGELRAEFPIDHVLVASLAGRALVPGATILVVPASGPIDRVCRLDPADRATLGRSMLGAALDRVSAAMQPGAEAPAEEPGEVALDSSSAPPAAPQPAPAALDSSMAPPPETTVSKAAAKGLAVQAAAKVALPGGSKSTVTEILGGDRSPVSIPSSIPEKETLLTPELADAKFQAVDNGYVQSGLMSRDQVLILSSLSRDADLPLFLQSVERTDVSDALNAKEELGVTMVDMQGRPHRFRFELPIVTRDGRLYLNGEYWDVQKQILAKPVIKVKPDEVLITTAYNKAIVTRFGANASPRSAGLRSALLAGEALLPGVAVRKGEASSDGRPSAVEFDDLGSEVIGIDTPRVSFAFSREPADKLVHDLAPWSDAVLAGLDDSGTAQPFGAAKDGSAVYLTDQNGTALVLLKGRAAPVQIGSSMAGVVAREALGSEDALPVLGGRKYAYTRVRMLMKQVPLIVAVGLGGGLSAVLNRYGVKYQIVDAEAFRKINRRGRDYIKFEDGYLLYEPRLRDSLLLNGLKEAASDAHPIAAFGPKGDGWLDYLAGRYGTGFAKKVRNFELGLIDPISAEVLRDMGIPEDYVGLLLYCNTLLEGNQHSASNDLASYRIRGLEVVNSILYSVLQREAEKVRATAGRAGRATKLSIPPTEVINQLLQSSNVNTSSDLNPLLEAELRGRAAWTGGGGGMGNPEMVTKEMRAFHPSMRGVFGFYSPDSQSIGVSRSLSYKAAVNSARGYLDPGSGTTAGELLALGELMSPFTSQHSDPPRIGMQSKQATHTMPVTKSSPMLVGSGAERSLAHVIGNTFAYKARAKGVLQRVDLKNAVAVIAHDDGSTSLVDLSARSVKNSVGGWEKSPSCR